MGTTNCACIREYINRESTMEQDMISSPMQNRQELQHKELSLEESMMPQTAELMLSFTYNAQIELQSVVRGHMARQQFSGALREARNHRAAKQSDKESRMPENRYKVITSNLKELFKDAVSLKMDEKYGRADISEPLYDGIKVEEKPAFLIESEVIYKGEWDEQGNRHGRGREAHPDGTRYTGYYCSNHKEGWGRLIFANGDMYTGDFRKDQIHGNGTIRYSNGNTFEGKFKRGLKEGIGKEILANGAVYEGQFSNDKRHGQGILKLQNGDTFTGEFKNGLMDGMGSLETNRGHSYVGSWREGKMHGEGTYTSKEGSYRGAFVNDVKQGFGKFEYTDGRVYEGEWKDGQQHGEGWLRSSDDTKKGLFRNGRRLKWID